MNPYTFMGLVAKPNPKHIALLGCPRPADASRAKDPLPVPTDYATEIKKAFVKKITGKPIKAIVAQLERMIGPGLLLWLWQIVFSTKEKKVPADNTLVDAVQPIPGAPLDCRRRGRSFRTD